MAAVGWAKQTASKTAVEEAATPTCPAQATIQKKLQVCKQQPSTPQHQSHNVPQHATPLLLPCN
jgi:hypothetical protein